MNWIDRNFTSHLVDERGEIHATVRAEGGPYDMTWVIDAKSPSKFKGRRFISKEAAQKAWEEP